MKTVGILGGMGPDATLLLMQKVMMGIKAEDDSSHIPLIVHQNTQVPSRIKRIIENTGADPVPVLQQMASDLEKMNCDFLAMPCNTAHFFYKEVGDSVSVPLLNMIELSAKKVFDLQLSKIGILASPAVKKVGVFEESFKRYKLTKKFSEDEDNLLKIIKDIKKGCRDKRIVENFKSQIMMLAESDCDGILIACTELSLLKNHVPKSLICLDSLDCLVERIISMAVSDSMNEISDPK